MRPRTYRPMSKGVRTAMEGGRGLQRNYRIKQMFAVLLTMILTAIILVIFVFLFSYFFGN